MLCVQVGVNRFPVKNSKLKLYSPANLPNKKCILGKKMTFRPNVSPFRPSKWAQAGMIWC